MRMKWQNDLLLLNIITVLLLFIITLFPSNALRIALGLPFVLFFPGYVLTAALFPRRNVLDGIERVALSFGLSIVVVSLVGVILNYTPWGIKLYPILISLAVFVAVISIVAWYRRRRLGEAGRFTVPFRLNLASWRGQKFVDKLLTIILIGAILGAIGTLSYVIATPKVGEKFTEFYILGLEGQAIEYPKDMKVGEQGRVLVGIINREQETVTYWLKVQLDGVSKSQIGPIELAHGENWTEIVGFAPHRAGDEQKVEFLLYRNGESKPHRELHLWINVKERE